MDRQHSSFMTFPRSIAVAALLVAFVLVGAGVWLNTSMDTGTGMVGCPFSVGSMSLCQMDAFSHLAQFRATFSVPFALGSAELMLVLLAIVVVSTLGAVLWKILAPPGWYAWHRYVHRQQFTVFRYLTEAFSSGILHPKLYV